MQGERYRGDLMRRAGKTRAAREPATSQAFLSYCLEMPAARRTTMRDATNLLTATPDAEVFRRPVRAVL